MNTRISVNLWADGTSKEWGSPNQLKCSQIYRRIVPQVPASRNATTTTTTTIVALAIEVNYQPNRWNVCTEQVRRAFFIE